MKKFILGGVAAIMFVVLAINMDTASASAYEDALSNAKMECRWKRLDGYESCVQDGDGYACKCGSTTRPKPNTADDQQGTLQ
jgi:hypothetical protein